MKRSKWKLSRRLSSPSPPPFPSTSPRPPYFYQHTRLLHMLTFASVREAHGEDSFRRTPHTDGTRQRQKCRKSIHLRVFSRFCRRISFYTCRGEERSLSLASSMYSSTLLPRRPWDAPLAGVWRRKNGNKTFLRLQFYGPYTFSSDLTGLFLHHLARPNRRLGLSAEGGKEEFRMSFSRVYFQKKEEHSHFRTITFTRDYLR